MMQTDQSLLPGVRDPKGTIAASTKANAATRQSDWYIPFVVVISAIMAVCSFIYYFNNGTILAYSDAQSRLLISKRVLESPTPGFAQLGSVWLPLTHVAADLLIGNDYFYRTGIAISVFSMISFVITTIFLYKTLVFLTNDRGTGLLAVLMFITNPNILYMQATPMTELPMYATMMLSVYYLLRLSKEPENRTLFFLSGLMIALGTLVRYETWALLFAEIPLLIYIFLRNRFAVRKIEGMLIYWSYWAFAGIGVWLIWNLMIFGDPLTFQRGEYAKPSLWVSARDIAIGNFGISLSTYIYAAIATIGPVLILGIIGLVFYLIQNRLKPTSIALYGLLAQFPFFVIMLYMGQRPLKVPELSSEMYNLRFALVMLLPVVIFAAYMAQRRGWAKVIMAGATIVAIPYMTKNYGVITLREPTSITDSKMKTLQREAANWLAAHYDGAPMILESYGNEDLQFLSGISLKNVIYEGSYKLWDLALKEPEKYAEWVVMRQEVNDGGSITPPDKLWRALHDDPGFQDNYELVFQSAGFSFYHRHPDLVKPISS